MWKSKIIIEPTVRERIANSSELKKEEKENFLRFVAYLTIEETEELMMII